jgi:predicted amidohydrolase
MIEPYYVAVCQAATIPPRLGGLARLRENVGKNLQHYCDLIDLACAGNHGEAAPYALFNPVRLVTFGEFAITGAYSGMERTDHRFNNREVIEHLAIGIPGPETDVLAAKAKQHGAYIAAVNFEKDPDWPDFHFNTGFILNPQGKIILKYRKTLTNQPVEISCSPHDIQDAYRNPVTLKFDPFPVVETAIGRLAVMVCNDLNAPEIPRIYSMEGAEVILHLTTGLTSSEGGWHATGVMEAVKRARAYDNAVYFVNSNFGPSLGSTYPANQISGFSTVIDYQGSEIVRAEDSAERVLRTRLDIEACRAFRARYYKNPVSQIRSELYAPFLNKPVYPANTFLKEGPIEATLDATQRARFEQAMANLRECENYYREDEV